MSNFWRKITSFYQLSEWNENSQYVCFVTLLYSSTFYSLFLPFFVLEIFKFKYDKVFVRHSASISKFEWFEQLWGHGYDLVWPTFCSKFCPNILHWKPAKKIKLGVILGQNLGQIMSNVMKKVKITAVLAGNNTFLTENITQDRKRLITQSKHMIFW